MTQSYSLIESLEAGHLSTNPIVQVSRPEPVKKVCPFHHPKDPPNWLRLSEERAQWQIGLDLLPARSFHSLLCILLLISYRVIRVPQCMLPHSARKRCDYETSRSLALRRQSSLFVTENLAHFVRPSNWQSTASYCSPLEGKHGACLCRSSGTKDVAMTNPTQLGPNWADITLTRCWQDVVLES